VVLDRLEVRELDLQAARGRRLSQRRHARALRRLHTRRRVLRFVLAVSAVTALVLLDTPGPPKAADIAAPRATAARCPVPPDLRHAFVTAAAATHVPLPLLVAVARVESRFDAGARSRAGAIGLLQLMPRTAGELHYDPAQTSSNVMAGALYLRRQLEHYQSTALALAAYNAGPNAVDRLGASPSPETAGYVARVTRTRLAYGRCD
jgi:soluble lytic murein transglycosylase-like protein